MEDLGASTHNDRVFHRPLAWLVLITSAELLILLADRIGQPYSTVRFKAMLTAIWWVVRPCLTSSSDHTPHSRDSRGQPQSAETRQGLLVYFWSWWWLGECVSEWDLEVS